TADYRHGSGLDGEQQLQFPLSLADADDLDARMAYDLNGRIRGKRSGGGASVDSAVYGYFAAGHRLAAVSRRLAATAERDASNPEDFRYDAEGRMTRDLSRNLEVSYGEGARPIEFSLRNGHRETALHEFHDADGRRVSQIVAPRLSGGFPVYWVGAAE